MTDPPTPGVYYSATGKKTFVPLENNPAVFTSLIHHLGVSPALTFHDIYSLTDPALLSLVPRPTHALIFISPSKVYHRVRSHDADGKELRDAGSGPDENVMWFKQTIGNACGLIALLHAVANGSAREFVKAGSALEGILQAAEPLKPVERARLLYDSVALERAHMAVAVQGDTVAPIAAEHVGYHFICFVKGRDGHLWELEGGWEGPIDRGVLREGEDVLSERALEAGVRRYVRAAEGNVDFSVVALAGEMEE
ncbi:hypothetical protein B0A50_08475 [Salinomyces thailandicus]|uniref:Ubiquitin carboxyl-terminal hydrolase n=1 Tax=Salinomyces thailandicus TaxID=706561 RepID=A0A4U0TK02_9PEZI|nr:hypothetical protein B0A50_08475 [Salinomyces thailandica]